MLRPRQLIDAFEAAFGAGAGEALTLVCTERNGALSGGDPHRPEAPCRSTARWTGDDLYLGGPPPAGSCPDTMRIDVPDQMPLAAVLRTAAPSAKKTACRSHYLRSLPPWPVNKTSFLPAARKAGRVLRGSSSGAPSMPAIITLIATLFYVNGPSIGLTIFSVLLVLGGVFVTAIALLRS